MTILSASPRAVTIATALVAFTLAAAILTITPGLDTVMVVRARLSAGRNPALLAALGIAVGCLVWGIAVALGLGAVLKAAPAIYTGLRWAGALYLFWCGLRLVLRPRDRLDLDTRTSAMGPNLFLMGLLTNLLNPKVGLFYLSFLPQFVPAGVPGVPFMIGLAAIHAVMGLVWLSTLALSLGIVRRFVLRPAALRWLDRMTGAVFIGFGLKLVLDRG